MLTDIGRPEALEYGRATGEGFSALLAAAAGKRDAFYGRHVTYSPKVFVPLTNMCRNTCKYCVFVQSPDKATARYMTPEEVLDAVREGERAGCLEALFSLGENPEAKYAEARETLNQLGYASTIDYLVAMCQLVRDESSLIPHVNAGAISSAAIESLKTCSASMGMMLETTSLRLMRRGEVHHACPDKAPKVRLETIRAAGQLKVPFTTGILIGIGETWAERVDSLLAIKDMHLRYGHIQEAIVQNFRAKPGTSAQGWAEPDLDDMLRTLAVARLLLPAEISLQAPPNLADKALSYLDAGINDWGGISNVTPDFINPERAWPLIDLLRSEMGKRGYTLRPRLTVYDSFIDRPGFIEVSMVGQIEKSSLSTSSQAAVG